jgi:O-antigen ligase
MTHPHNFYAQLLAETGIFGFGIVSIAFIYIIIYLFKITSSVAKKYEFSKEGLIISSLGLLIHLWPLTPHGSFFTNYNCIFIFLCLGFFLGEKKII